MPIQHSQYNCSTCKRATMHVRHEAEVNHVLHLLASVFLCGAWLPVWFLIALRHSLGAGEVWRCQNCGTGLGLFGGSPAGRIVAIDAKPAGPSTRAKVRNSRCPKCGCEMVPGVELGAEVLSCGRCGETFERA
jgi:ribosomal protein L37AE/L43A